MHDTCSYAVLPSPSSIIGSLACSSASLVPLSCAAVGAMLGITTYSAGPYTSSVARKVITALREMVRRQTRC